MIKYKYINYLLINIMLEKIKARLIENKKNIIIWIIILLWICLFLYFYIFIL